MPVVLVVDDEKILRFTFREILEEDGYSVITAENYESALKRIEQGGIDLIVTDIILGGRTGIDLLRKVREMNLKCPVIVLTGYPDVATASEAVRLGAFNYLSKPVDQDKLLSAVRVAIKYKDSVEREERYRTNLEAIFKSVNEGIVTVDNNLNVIELNAAAIAICGLDRKDIGKSYNSIHSRCSGLCTRALEETISGGKPVKLHRIDCHIDQSDGQVVSITAAPLVVEDGSYAGAVMVIADESRLARLEKDLKERKSFSNIIGESSKMQNIYRLIESLSNVDTTVLVSGESGTGKELVAEALHMGSKKRGRKELVFINCAAIPENLIESELFGHEKGAFTGAISMKKGKFELASGGTIVLDEIGDMSLSMQAKLLRVLEQSEFHRVGGEKSIKIDTRVIASTNKDLREKVVKGEFREDLFYRLKIVEIYLPPLRERLADLKLLISHFVDLFNNRFNKHIKGITPQSEKLFMHYPWPGNVRELEHVLEHAFIMCGGQYIGVEDLPDDVKNAGGGISRTYEGGESDAEKIAQVLESVKWNRTEAAKLLGIDRSTLYRKMKKYKMD